MDAGIFRGHCTISAMNKKKVGIFGASMLEWGGGIDLLKNIINALHYDSDSYELFLFVPVPGSDLKSKLKRAAQRMLGRNVFKGIDEKVVSNMKEEYPFLEITPFVNSAEGLIQKVKETGIELLFPCAYSMSSAFPVPWVSYLPDFQHKYLPDFFTKEEIRHRDVTIGKRVTDGDALMVTSETAKEDIRKYYPECRKDICVIPFSPAPRQVWLDTEGSVLEKYGFPSGMKYFLISNQFWIHKDHPCAFRALAELHKTAEFRDIHIICTGATEDYRNPNYLNELNQLNSGLGISDRVHFLGYIPKIDQILLMKESIAVIQPTLYEGSPGGGEVEDAVSLGVRSVVSDIPVNREMEEETVTFFRGGDVIDLAEKMKEMICTEYTRPGKETLVTLGRQRQKHYYDILRAMIDALTEKKEN